MKSFRHSKQNNVTLWRMHLRMLPIPLSSTIRVGQAWASKQAYGRDARATSCTTFAWHAPRGIGVARPLAPGLDELPAKVGGGEVDGVGDLLAGAGSDGDGMLPPGMNDTIRMLVLPFDCSTDELVNRPLVSFPDKFSSP